MQNHLIAQPGEAKGRRRSAPWVLDKVVLTCHSESMPGRLIPQPLQQWPIREVALVTPV